MPAKMARSAPRPPFGAPGMTAIVRAARRSCDNEGKSAKFKRNRGSSGESRINGFRRRRAYTNPPPQNWNQK